ncbi:MAG: response regulator transcription factor [Pseudobdellovibrionaceae bacterium]
MLKKILLVDDQISMQMTVQASIGHLGKHEVAHGVDQARAALDKNSYELIILDVNLPDGNGFDFCKFLKNSSKFQNLPIFFLTGEKEIDKKVLGFNLGAEDYIVKPFEPQEFAARVEAKIKRKPPTLGSTMAAAGFFIDLTQQKASIGSAPGTGQILSLTPIEFKLLVHFLRNQGLTLSRETLLTAIWGDTVHVSAHTLDTHISSLRKKLGDSGKYIKSVIKKGYCFSPEITT